MCCFFSNNAITAPSICKLFSPWNAFESFSICLEPAYLHRCSQGTTLVSGVSWGIALEWWECFLSFSGGCTRSAYWCFLFSHMVAQIPHRPPLLYAECKTVERIPWFMTFSSIVVVNFVFIYILTCCSLLSQSESQQGHRQHPHTTVLFYLLSLVQRRQEIKSSETSPQSRIRGHENKPAQLCETSHKYTSNLELNFGKPAFTAVLNLV